MKTLLNLKNGAVLITEDAGVVTIAVDESLNVGGGQAEGIVSLSGKAAVVLSGPAAEKLLIADLNKELPASVQAPAAAVEAVLEAGIAAIE